MLVTQAYQLSNDITKETLGESVILAEDLSNIVDVGNALFNAQLVENYVRKLVDRIGKVIFVNRAYSGMMPNVLMDDWEYGSVVEKINGDLPEATENEEWELVNGASYDPNVVTLPKVSVKFFNSKITFEVDITITEEQCKSAFTSREAYNAFISMIYGLVEKAMTLKIDGLISRTITNAIAETYNDGNAVRAVNLLTGYNAEMGTTLTADKAIHDKDFIRYASFIIKLYVGRLQRMSRLFNVEGQARFTPKDMLHIAMLDEFATASETFLESSTYWKELVALPNGVDKVPFWQGSGTSYSFADCSKVSVAKTGSGAEDVEVTGVLACIWDRDALGVRQPRRAVRSQYNAKGNFTNAFYVWDSSLFNDLGENFVMFYIA